MQRNKAKALNTTTECCGAFFRENQDIGDIDVLTQLAGEMGLNGKEYRESLVTRKYKEAHQKALQDANEEAEITAVPTFIIGDTKVAGIRSKETLEQIIDDEFSRKKNGYP